ncbi:c-type cytochrome [Caenimonas terrae]|uniref:C-type cytochrome n=1 Tax=Caenimonas terrae TaxID=696074 RepID=A0ABW0NAR9_9BURK
MKFAQMFCVAALLAGAATGPMAADLAAGAAKAQVCFACHGPAGISQMAETPSLAGQPDGFIQWQLVFFRSGVRKSPVMQPLAATLKDDEIRNLAAFFAAQAPAKADPAAKGEEALLAAGRKLAQANRCANCHRDDFSGIPAQATPRLAGQREDYLVKALREFKGGQRSGGAMAAMADVVYPLKDDDLRALAHFLAHVPS